MEEQSICAPLLAESDTKNNNDSNFNVASISDADTVINTNNTNSSQIEDPGKRPPLTDLLTDSRCHVCEASLLFQSQRAAHYEGKKHAQKVRLYLQAKKDEKLSKDPGGFQRGVTVDKDRFCELCSMVFSSPVVARSHYHGKVHAKNLRKLGLRPAAQTKDACPRGPEVTSSRPLQAPGSDQGAGTGVGTPPADSSVSVDLSDPDKHCGLCAASFNNPYMARQHYAGRKHQRNHARQQLLRALGGDPVRATAFTCPVCNVELNSVEMYQSHMQGNKHQIKEKKVVDLCKSQKKVYDSFAEELADYIHVQKARGIAPNTRLGGTTGDEGGPEGVANLSKVDGQNKTSSSLPSSCRPLFPVITPQQTAQAFHPPPLWSPTYQAPPVYLGFRGNMYEQAAFGHAFPHPLPLGSPLTGVIGRHLPRRRANQSSSSTTSNTTSSSSYTSSSDSDCDHHYRKRRRRKRKEDRGRTMREEEEEDRRRRRGGHDTGGRGEGEPDAVEKRVSMRRKRQHRRSRSHGEGRRAKRRQVEGEEGAKEENEQSKEQRVCGEGEETEVYMQAETQEETKESQEVREDRAKHRRDKKRTKEKVDSRTEEEKLWDESITGL